MNGLMAAGPGASPGQRGAGKTEHRLILYTVAVILLLKWALGLVSS